MNISRIFEENCAYKALFGFAQSAKSFVANWSIVIFLSCISICSNFVYKSLQNSPKCANNAGHKLFFLLTISPQGKATVLRTRIGIRVNENKKAVGEGTENPVLKKETRDKILLWFKRRGRSGNLAIGEPISSSFFFIR